MFEVSAEGNKNDRPLHVKSGRCSEVQDELLFSRQHSVPLSRSFPSVHRSLNYDCWYQNIGAFTEKTLSLIHDTRCQAAAIFHYGS